MNETIWKISDSTEQTHALSRSLQLPETITQILVNRGITDKKKAEHFLNGTLDDLFDPFLLQGMRAAVDRLNQAAASREKVVIFGDYDVDGILSVVILTRALESLGIRVEYFIPDRLKDGYGIKTEYIRIVQEKEATVVVSVDCGIKAVEFVQQAAEIGVDVIITDHHQPGEVLPAALAVINPVAQESVYPDRNLAGIGVVFKLIQALLSDNGKADVLPHYLKLVSIGTVADIVSLQNENRLFVKYGLQGLRNIANYGLKCLIEVCGLGGKKINTGDIGFRIGPRINAAGRMGKADLSVRLFFSESEQECRQLAAQLDELNSQRQKVEKKIFDQAVRTIKEKSLHKRYKLLILGCEEWHRGVIGIVASKVKETFNRPTIFFAYKNGTAYGSGRSIKEFALIDCLERHKRFFYNYGGHPMAIGCELACDNMMAFKNAVNKFAADAIKPEFLKKKISIDIKMDFDELNGDFLEHYELLAPFGLGNPRPVFVTEDACLIKDPQLIKKSHCKLVLQQNGRVFEALGWGRGNWASSLNKGDRIDIVYSLQFSEYRGEERLNLNLQDIKPHT